MYSFRSNNFRLRRRLYPIQYTFPGYYRLESSNVADVDQTNTNFGTQENVSQNSVINQSSYSSVERG